MDGDEFSLINALINQNEEMRVIAVGDDDQNIFEFRGSSAKYLQQMINDKNAVMYEMVANYRSRGNLVDFSNQFIRRLPKRMKSTPVIAVQKEPGIIRLKRYRSSNLVVPLVKDIQMEDISGTTCVLCKTNEEALQITGLLLKNGMQAKLIQTNEGFSLYNLAEVRFFLEQLHLSGEGYTIDDDTWEKAKRNLFQRFGGSTNLELCNSIIRDFEAVNTKNKYKTDLEIFIRESQLEDFYGENVETIFVSTIHKAKGREFDNVFLVLDQFQPGCMGEQLKHSTTSPDSDEAIRQLYVGLTRAKRNLVVHYNGSYLESIKVDKLEKEYDETVHLPPAQLAMQLSFKDVWLDNFMYCQRLIAELKSGDVLVVDGDGCVNARGKQVLKFSKQFISRIEYMKQRNYVPRTAVVNFIIYWQKENAESETKIILPQVYFTRDGGGNPSIPATL